jgi:hypothetical protein
MGAAAPTLEESSVRDAVCAAARSLERTWVCRHAPEQQATHLRQGLQELTLILEALPSFTMTIDRAGFLYEGRLLQGDPTREDAFCHHLYREGLRALTFERGLVLEEMRLFAELALSDPQAVDREDAVTGLWKAELAHIGCERSAGYGMDEPASEGVCATAEEIGARVEAALTPDALVEGDPQPLLWNEAQRAAADPRDWARLASRAAQTVLRIVAEDYAGWDIEALKETFAKLADQLLEQKAALPLGQALVALKALPGPHGAEFRDWMAPWLLDPARLAFAAEVADAARLLSPWLALVPKHAGRVLLPLVPRAREQGAREALAAAMVARLESCRAEVAQLLRTGDAAEARPILAALLTEAAVARAEVAAAGLLNPDPLVVLDAIAVVAQDTASAARNLGPLLEHPSRPVRVAAASALALVTSGIERAGGFFIHAIARPGFAQMDAEEKGVFYRALGRLGSTVGFLYLSSQLSLSPKKFFGRRRRLEARFLAIEGLAEEATPRTLRALDEGSSNGRAYSKPVAAACKAAAQRVRTRKPG